MKWTFALILALGLIVVAALRHPSPPPLPAAGPADSAPVVPASTESSSLPTSSAPPITMRTELPAPPPRETMATESGVDARLNRTADAPFVVDGITRALPFKLNTEVGLPAPEPTYPVDGEVGHIEAGPYAAAPPPLKLARPKADRK